MIIDKKEHELVLPEELLNIVKVCEKEYTTAIRHQPGKIDWKEARTLHRIVEKEYGVVRSRSTPRLANNFG